MELFPRIKTRSCRNLQTSNNNFFMVCYVRCELNKLSFPCKANTHILFQIESVNLNTWGLFTLSKDESKSELVVKGILKIVNGAVSIKEESSFRSM